MLVPTIASCVFIIIYVLILPMYKSYWEYIGNFVNIHLFLRGTQATIRFFNTTEIDQATNYHNINIKYIN